MKPHVISLAAGTLLALATVGSADAQTPFSVNLTPGMDNVARETKARDASAVAQLLAGGQDPNQVDNGRSALVIAAIDDNAQIAAMLLKAGARPDDKDDEGDGALHHAVELNHLDIVQMLLDAGAAVDAANREGITPLMLAASHGYATEVELLLAKGANPEKTDFTGRDALGWAGNQPRVVQLLQRAAGQH
jgi:uncharacterized protein